MPALVCEEEPQSGAIRITPQREDILELRLDTLTPVSIDTWTLLDTIDTSDTSVNRHTPTPL